MSFCLNDYLKNFPGYKDISNDDLKQIHERFHCLVDIARAKGRIHPDAVGAIMGWNLIYRSIESFTEESQLQLVIPEIKESNNFDKGTTNQSGATILISSEVQQQLKDKQLQKINHQIQKLERVKERQRLTEANAVKTKYQLLKFMKNYAQNIKMKVMQIQIQHGKTQ